MVFKVNKTNDYSIISNRFLREKNMSLKAKGLLALMLSLPNSWEYSINGLVAICKEEESAIKTTLCELKKFGYLVIDKHMPNATQSGRIEYVYNIYENPQQKQEGDFLPLEILPLENQVQYNTNKENTNNLCIKENSKKETETKSTTTLQANDENQLSIESVGIETKTNTCTTLTAHNEMSDYNKVVGYFEQTWGIYPRKESKIQARTTFAHKVFTKSQTESHKLALRIYKTLERQKVVWGNENNGKGRDKQYIPLFSSWLNDNFEDIPKKDRGKI